MIINGKNYYAHKTDDEMDERPVATSCQNLVMSSELELFLAMR